MTNTFVFDTAQMSVEEIHSVARAIMQGAVVVFPTDTVYGIGASSFAPQAIDRIYQIKERPPQMPLQILLADSSQAQAVARFDVQAQKLADAFWPGGLTLVVPAAPAGEALLRGFAGLGLRVPGHRFLLALLRALSVPLASSSANVHGQPVLTDPEKILSAFNGKVDYILLGGILSPVASSVVDLTQEPKLIREASLSKARLEEVLGQPLL